MKTPSRSPLSVATCIVLCALASAVAMADYSPVRAQTFAFEKQFSERALALWGDDRYMFFLRPQAYFVDHFGILLTTDLNLAPGPVPLFRGPISKQEIATHKRIVLQRMPKFRQFLKSELMDAAAMFPGEPDADRLSIAVTIYHFAWEDTADIPTQIVAQGVKKDLLAAKANPVLADHAIEMRDTE
ncbi:MAG TPA: hypothetical protein VG168_00440 [Bryobacteraceae bacterium]|nr:hypothetical protein [Bryobacteraceae bacterium]